MAVAFSSLPVGPGTGTNTANSATAGIAEANSFVATKSGLINTVAFFVRTANTAINVHFAIYADSAGSPGARLGPEVVLAAPVANAWNYIPGLAAQVVAGQTYWVVYLSPSGGNTLLYSDNAASGGNVKASTSTTLAVLADPAPAYGTGPFTNQPNVGVLGDEASSSRNPILTMLMQRGRLRALALQLLHPVPAAVVVSAVTYDKTGAVAAGAVMAGDGPAEYSRTGAVLADTVLAGGRIRETPKTGAVAADTTLAGGDVHEAARTGTVRNAGLGYNAQALADSPVDYWRLGETSGTNAVDIVAGKDGTYNGGFTLGVTGALAGDTDKAVTLNGSNAFVGVPSTVPSFSGVAVSFEAWMKTSDTAQGNQLLYGDYLTSGGFDGWGVIYSLSGSQKIGYWSSVNGSWVESTTTITDTNWHHIVVTVSSGGAVSFYVDGATAGTASSAAPGNQTGAKAIGASADGAGSYFKGSIDEVALYQAVLTGARVAAHFDSAGGASGGAVLSGTSLKTNAGKSGFVAAGAVAAGADVYEATETGAVTSAARAAGPDVFTASETGATAAGAKSQGADVFTATETGTAAAGSKATGADEATVNRTGAVTSAARAAGGDVHEASRTGSTAAGSKTGGADVFESTETGAVTTGALLRGVGQAGFTSKLGSVAAGAFALGADVYTATETGAVVTGTLLSGADVFTATETGAVTAGTRAAGTSTKVSPTIYVKAGAFTTGALLSGPDSVTTSKTGTVKASPLVRGSSSSASALARWNITPSPNWPGSTSGRWGATTSQRWTAGTASDRWDIDPSDKWDLVR